MSSWAGARGRGRTPSRDRAPVSQTVCGFEPRQAYRGPVGPARHAPVAQRTELPTSDRREGKAMTASDAKTVGRPPTGSTMKVCGTCKKRRRLTSFAMRSSVNDTRQSQCKSCQNVATRAHYAKYTPYYVAKAKKRRAEVVGETRLWLRSYLETHPCVDCVEDDIRCLIFDHVRGVKVAGIGVLIARQFPMGRILAEVEKCEVRCANCHAKKTSTDFAWWNAALAEEEVEAIEGQPPGIAA